MIATLIKHSTLTCTPYTHVMWFQNTDGLHLLNSNPDLGVVPLTKFRHYILGIWASPIIVWSPSAKLDVYSDSKIPTSQFMSRSLYFYLHKCRMPRSKLWHFAYPYFKKKKSFLTPPFWNLAFFQKSVKLSFAFPFLKTNFESFNHIIGRQKKKRTNITDPLTILMA